MQTWGEAYARLRTEKRFAAYFGRMGRIPGPNDFAYRAYVLVFENVIGHSPGDPDDSPLFGPESVIFATGAVILGITAGAYHRVQAVDTDRTNYPPSTGTARRDLFKLFLQHTDGEKITSDQETLSPLVGAELNVPAEVLADALMGEGQKDDFPREIVVPPSTGVNVSVKSYMPASDGADIEMPALTVHVVFHVVVPRG